MNEQLLRFIWKFRLYENALLETTLGEKVEVIHTGTYHTDGGPDFQNARIKIGSTLWAGNVELHVNASDWFLHSHQNDAAYDNVILHVVYEQKGEPAKRQNGEPIPVLELKPLIKPGTLSRYHQLEKQQKVIPCADFFPQVSTQLNTAFRTRLMVERLEEKVTRVNALLNENTGNWEQVIFSLVARYFGGGVNRDPFEQLAKLVPIKLWAKYVHEPLQVEALLFGQAGLLDERTEDEYPNQLRKEFLYLKRLHNLEPMPKHVWKLLRMRPANFPTIRLAQLAALLCKETHIFSSILHAADVKSIHRFFDVDVSPYWKTHYLFDKASNKVKSHIGTSTKNILLINAVAPVLFAYGKYKSEEIYCERALQLLEDCTAETNKIITDWKNLGVSTSHAFDTQALLQLRTAYCNRFRCLECNIGLHILK